jgi:hypothetical protein
MTRRYSSFGIFLAVAILCSGCLKGADERAHSRVNAVIASAQSKLSQRKATQISVSGTTFRAAGTLSAKPSESADIHFSGNNGEWFDRIENKDATTTLSKGTRQQQWRAGDVALFATRIPVQKPEAFIALLSGAMTGDEFGGVEVNGKSARRYDAVISIDKLAQLSDPNAKLLAQLYRPYAHEFAVQVDIDEDGNVLRILYPANPRASKIEATDEGGAFNAVSVDFTYR